MEMFCFAISIAGLNRPTTKNRNKDDNDDEIYKHKGWITSIGTVLKRMHCTSY
jgi:hypothetical protein